MLRKHLIILGAACAFVVPASAWSKPRLTTDAAHDVNFANYKTFTWASTQPPAGFNSVQYHRVMGQITDRLKTKGYDHQPTGDLTMALTVGKQTRVDLDNWSHWGYHADYAYHEGQISLDAFDTKTKRAVWHGQVTDSMNPKKPDPEKVQAAVDQMIEQFPGH